MISCADYDFIEIVCIYRYPVTLLLPMVIVFLVLHSTPREMSINVNALNWDGKNKLSLSCLKRYGV